MRYTLVIINSTALNMNHYFFNPLINKKYIQLILLIIFCLPEKIISAQESDQLSTMYLDAIADKMYTEADQIAKQLIEDAIDKYGLDSHQSASAMVNLAIAQLGQDDFESAILNYENAIDIIERIENYLDERLINPLKGLAEAQLKSNRSDLAELSFNRALHISHVNNGPHNLEQMESLKSLADLYVESKENKKAADIEKRIYYLQSRNVDPNSLAMIPALKTLAQSQRKSNQFERERRSWRKVIKIIQDKKGKDSLDLLDPLTELGRSYLYVDFSTMSYDDPPVVSKGDGFLRKAIQIAEKNPDATWLQRVEAKINLADFYVLSDRANRSYTVYRDAWDMLSEDEIKLQYRAASLETPVILEKINPPLYFDDTTKSNRDELPENYKEAVVSFNFSVSKRGLARDINRASFNPDGLDEMHKIIGSEIRYLVYRPKFVDREPVIAQNVSYEHRFFFKQQASISPTNDES